MVSDRIGNRYLCHGDEDRAVEIFECVIETDAPAASGTIATEAELARRRRDPDADWESAGMR